MKPEELERELNRRKIVDDCYIEITLNDGTIFSGKYNSQGKQGGINLYTTRMGLGHYDASKIKSLAKLPIRRNEIPEHLEEIMRECDEWN